MPQSRRSIFSIQSDYNRWMNERLYATCARLDEGLRRQDMGAFFGSIHGTLNHLLLGDRLWMGRFTGRDFPVDSLDQELYTDFADLHTARRETDEAIGRWIEGLTEDSLDTPLAFETIVVTGRTHRFRLVDALVHFFQHQVHHRGQVTCLLSQLGIDYGTTDMMWMPGIELIDH